MDTIAIPESSRRWDVLSLGEVMLRLDPGESRIHTTRQLQVWEGGGEYNVAPGIAPLLWASRRDCDGAGG